MKGGHVSREDGGYDGPWESQEPSTATSALSVLAKDPPTPGALKNPCPTKQEQEPPTSLRSPINTHCR